MKTLTRFRLTVPLVVALALTACGESGRPTLSVTNQSSTSLSGMVVRLGGNEISIPELPPLKTFTRKYKIQRDSNIVVQIGKKETVLDKYIGGTSNNVRITVQQDGVTAELY